MNDIKNALKEALMRRKQGLSSQFNDNTDQLPQMGAEKMAAKSKMQDDKMKQQDLAPEIKDKGENGGEIEISMDAPEEQAKELSVDDLAELLGITSQDLMGSDQPKSLKIRAARDLAQKQGVK